MSAARPSLFGETVAQKIAIQVWPSWCATPAGLAEAIAVVEEVLEHRRVVRPLSLHEVAEILRLAAELEKA